MKKITYFLATVLATGSLVGCSDTVNENTGIGRLMLSAEISPELKLSRAVIEGQEAQKLADECLIWISNEKGLVREYKGISNVPTDGIWLTGGRYTAEAWSGDSVPASFTDRYFKGYQPFEIASGNVDKVDLKCAIANVGISVRYNVSEDVLHDYVLTVEHSAGSLTWTGADTRRGYFMMNSRDKDLKYTITGIDEKGDNFTASGSLKNVKGGIEYQLIVNHTSVNVEQGGAAFKIEIEESPMAIEQIITIDSAPLVLGREDNLEAIHTGEPGSLSDLGVYIVATSTLTHVVVDVTGMEEILGLDGPDFDILAHHMDPNAPSEFHDQLNEMGFDHYVNTPLDDSGDDMLIVLKKKLLDKLPVGDYNVTITATDEQEKVGTGVLKIKITDAVVQADQIAENSPAIWATQATLTGTVLKDTDTAGFNYREKGTSSWTYIEGTPASRAWNKGARYTVVLTGLKPGTIYEYYSMPAESAPMEPMTFTTEEAAQLPNSGFEQWVLGGDNSKAWLITDDANNMFWDSGNHGSSTMSKNVTTQETSIKHSGNSSLKMKSQFVGIGTIGKFAAGNVFIGKYLKTDGTDGELGWGRPWTSRPKQLRGYVRYEPVAITDESPSNGYKKGDMDTGIIYIALLDGSKKQGDSGYPDYPVVVKTKTPKLFNENSEDVIAYGKVEFNETTPGTGLVEFTITLDYRRTDIKPSYIMCTASASKGGDYFAGGNGSVMYLDDLELVY